MKEDELMNQEWVKKILACHKNDEELVKSIIIVSHTKGYLDGWQDGIHPVKKGKYIYDEFDRLMEEYENTPNRN